MKLNAQRKISLGALVLAAGAFVVDRCFFTPPAASARMDAALNQHVPTSTRKPAGVANPEDAEQLTDLSALSNRLQTAASAAHSDNGATRDAFRPSPVWIERAAGKNRKLMSPADEFRSKHQLVGVMTGPDSSWAIINGKTVGLGQMIGPFRLVKVSEHSAIFESAEAQVELPLAK